MQKLTEGEVELLHRWDRQDVSKLEIARRLRVHRNTITAHLKGRVAYSPALVLKLGLVGEPPPASGQRMTIYQAAALLPDQPSPSKLHRLIASGALRTERVGRALYTRQAWVRRCAARMFAPGLYFRSESVYVYASRPGDLLRSLAEKKYASPFASCRQISYYPAPTVVSVAEALEISLSVPAYRIKLAVAGLEAVGVYVL